MLAFPHPHPSRTHQFRRQHTPGRPPGVGQRPSMIQGPGGSGWRRASRPALQLHAVPQRGRHGFEHWRRPASPPRRSPELVRAGAIQHGRPGAGMPGHRGLADGRRAAGAPLETRGRSTKPGIPLTRRSSTPPGASQGRHLPPMALISAVLRRWKPSRHYLGHPRPHQPDPPVFPWLPERPSGRPPPLDPQDATGGGPATAWAMPARSIHLWRWGRLERRWARPRGPGGSPDAHARPEPSTEGPKQPCAPSRVHRRARSAPPEGRRPGR